MIPLAVIIVALVVVAAAMTVRMLRRDDPILGLTALVVALAAGFAAAFYGGLDSL